MLPAERGFNNCDPFSPNHAQDNHRGMETWLAMEQLGPKTTGHFGTAKAPGQLGSDGSVQHLFKLGPRACFWRKPWGDAVSIGDVSFNSPATGSSSPLLYYRWITSRANQRLAHFFWQLQGAEHQTPRRSSKSFLSQQGAWTCVFRDKTEA